MGQTTLDTQNLKIVLCRNLSYAYFLKVKTFPLHKNIKQNLLSFRMLNGQV